MDKCPWITVRLSRSKVPSLLIVLGVLLVVGAGVALISTQSGAGSAPLWTEGQLRLPSASPT